MTASADTNVSGVDRLERSPVDFLRLAVAVFVVLLAVVFDLLFGNAMAAFVSDLLRGFDVLPDGLVAAAVFAVRGLAIAVLGGGLAATLLRHRWRLLLSVVAAGLLAAGLFVVVSAVTGHDTASPITDVGDLPGPVDDPSFPSAPGLAAVTAVVASASPWVGRRWRRAAWTLVVGMAVTRFVTVPVGFDTLDAVLLGWLAGAGTVVALGAPTRRPTPDAVADGLASVGVPVTTLDKAGVDARGSTPYFGVGSDGRRLFVKALGEDERSADLLFRVFRWAQRRDLGDERPFSSLRRAVEHEALVALAARDIGVRTPHLAAFADVPPSGFVLAYEAVAGKSLDRLEPDELGDDLLAAIWAQICVLRNHRVAHRDLRLANIFLGDDGVIWMIDFGFSELAASELLLANDVAELVASSSLKVGAERAVTVARAAVGPDGMASALDRLKPWALSGATRSGLKADPQLLDDLRGRVEAASR